jgi:hypothetical protein
MMTCSISDCPAAKREARCGLQCGYRNVGMPCAVSGASQEAWQRALAAWLAVAALLGLA